jgi:pimeloyl-ACP methyl ester carboxylesterase
MVARYALGNPTGREIIMATRTWLTVPSAAVAACTALLGCASSPPPSDQGTGEVRDVRSTPVGPIEYTLKGHGPVILRLTGMSEDCESSMGSDALLAAGFSTLTPSRPGYGKTPSSVGRTAPEAADAMVALLDTLGIATVDVIAISGGGATAIHLAARHPERVRKLVLEEAVSRYQKEIDPERFETQKKFYGSGYGFTCFMLKVIATVSPKAMARQTMVLFGTHDPDEAVKEMSRKDIEAIQRFYLAQEASWASGASNDMEHRTGDAVLNSIEAPTLIVHSREDKAVSFSAAEYSHANIPASELWQAPSWSHFIFVGHGAGEVNRKVVEFLKDTE